MQGFYSCRAALKQRKSADQFRHLLNKDPLPVEMLNTLLKEAIQTPQDDFRPIMEELIKKGASVNFVETKDKKSLLMIACAESNAQVVVELLNRHADVQQKDEKNRTCMFYVIDNKSKQTALQIMTALLDKHSKLRDSTASLNKSILVATLEKGKYELAKLLLERGADPNQPQSDNLEAPLHYVARQLAKQPTAAAVRAIIRQLLIHKADPYQKNKRGETPLSLDEKSKVLEAEIQNTKAEKLRELVILKINDDEGVKAVLTEADEFIRQHRPQRKEEPQKQAPPPSTPTKLPSKTQSKKDVPAPEPPLSAPLAIGELYISSDQLRLYLDIEILAYRDQIDQENSRQRSTINELIGAIDKQLSNRKLQLTSYGSFALDLMMGHSDINLVAVLPGEFSLIDTVHDVQLVLRDMNEYIDLVESPRQHPVIKFLSAAEYGGRQFSLMIIHDVNNYIPQTSQLMLAYLRNYPEIKPLYLAMRNLLFSCKLSQPYNSGISSYALFTMLCAYVQSEYAATIIQQTLSLGRLLIGFLRFFGFEYDYYQKCVVLPEISAQSKAFVFDTPYSSIVDPILTVFDPTNRTHMIGMYSSFNTVQMQNLFRKVYILIHINYNCHQSECPSRSAIQRLATGKYECNPRPCCILRRIFRDVPNMLENQYAQSHAY